MRETGSLQDHPGYLTFALKKNLILSDVLPFYYGALLEWLPRVIPESVRVWNL